jgi:hypothetical protein
MAEPAPNQYFTSEAYIIRARPLWLQEITPTRFIYLQRFKGVVYLHIREFSVDELDVAVIPTQRGVCLNKQQTADLINELPTLLAMIKQVSAFFETNFIYFFWWML